MSSQPCLAAGHVRILARLLLQQLNLKHTSKRLAENSFVCFQADSILRLRSIALLSILNYQSLLGVSLDIVPRKGSDMLTEFECVNRHRETVLLAE